MAQHRQYSEDDKAVALAWLEAESGNIKRTAKALSIPPSTLRKWKSGVGVTAGVTQKGPQKEQTLADRLEAQAEAILLELPYKVEDATLRDAAIALGILVEKAQLLRGKATANIAHSGSVAFAALTDEELERRLAEAEGRAATSAVPV